jgi:hypothetical protein
MTRIAGCFVLFTALLFGVSSGQYAGTWTSNGWAGSGKVNLTLNGTEVSGFSFTYRDQLVQPKKVTVKIAESQVEFILELDLNGLQVKTSFQGAIDGKDISGKYVSTILEDGSALDSGTWKVTQQ